MIWTKKLFKKRFIELVLQFYANSFALSDISYIDHDEKAKVKFQIAMSGQFGTLAMFDKGLLAQSSG